MGRPASEKLLLAAPIVSIIIFAVVLFFNYAAGQSDVGVFSHSTGNISDKYQTFITPPGYTFIIWAVIYTWIAAGLVYALTQLCRRTDVGPVYVSPVTLPLSFWAIFNLNQCLNIGWLFIWDSEKLTAAAVVLVLTCLANWITMFFLVFRLQRAQQSLPAPSLLETILVRVFVHNGLAVYTTWTTIASLLNITIACVYVGEFSDEVTAAVVACLLAVIIIVWLLLELTVLDKYTRWVITPGFALVWALAGVYDNNHERATGPVPALLIVLLAVACVSLVVRMAALVVRVLHERSSGGMAVSTADDKAAFTLQ